MWRVSRSQEKSTQRVVETTFEYPEQLQQYAKIAFGMVNNSIEYRDAMCIYHP